MTTITKHVPKKILKKRISPQKASDAITLTLGDIVDKVKSKGYTIGKVIGKRANGIVYDGFDENGTPIIIKFIPANKKRSVSAEKIIPSYLNQLKNSCRPDLTCLLDYVIEKDSQYYAFVNRFMDGMPLNKIALEDFTFIEKLQICLGMATAIEFMHHNGVVHRDIKPQNTMVDVNIDGDITSVGIIDMDLACIPL
jgi:serine/threonine protein kinase